MPGIENQRYSVFANAASGYSRDLMLLVEPRRQDLGKLTP
jgi:hypothetical protein